MKNTLILLQSSWHIITKHKISIATDIFVFGLAIFTIDILLHYNSAITGTLNYIMYLCVYAYLGIKYSTLISLAKNIPTSAFLKIVTLFFLSPIILIIPFAILLTIVNTPPYSMVVVYFLSAIVAAYLLIIMAKLSWKILIPKKYDTQRTRPLSTLPTRSLFSIFTIQILLGITAASLNSVLAEGSKLVAYSSFFCLELIFIANIIFYFIISGVAFLHSRGITK